MDGSDRVPADLTSNSCQLFLSMEAFTRRRHVDDDEALGEKQRIFARWSTTRRTDPS